MDSSIANEPSTILATACPATGKEHLWEQAIGELIRTSLSFPGHLGATVLKPHTALDRQYRVITKFDSHEHMQRWYDSPERQACVVALSAFEAKPADIQHLTGLEAWFEPPQLEAHTEVAKQSHPPKYKMAVIIWIAVYATVLPMIAMLKPMVAGIHPLVSSAMLAAASVVLMTWIVMPILTRIFQAWLFPTAVKTDAAN
ncbi:antibiotic biosynthesis monooxygenase [Rubripirellula reticaptiva]|nr:antibiotic biosynthesis monooxygenase [Rubripirellula reticaptiva]